MLADLAARSHKIRRESMRRQFYERTRHHSRLHKMHQDIMIMYQTGQDASAESPAFLERFVMMGRPAVITAELLVCPAIPYLISTMQTACSMTDFLIIVHAFFLSNIMLKVISCNSPRHVFIYFSKIFTNLTIISIKNKF